MIEKETDLNTLSRREKEIFQGLLIGLSNKELADKLFISVNTVRSHTKSIYHKLGLRNRIDLLTTFR